MARQPKLPGMEQPRIAAIDEAASIYVKVEEAGDVEEDEATE